MQSSPDHPRVVIVDYGIGNLFSVQGACAASGIQAEITRDHAKILAASGVILPGVGAFGDAMITLARLDLIQPLRDVASAGTPLMGICLGVQLLMEESEEFGSHKGLGILAGSVRRLQSRERLKIPHVGWNRIVPPARRSWTGTPLSAVPVGVYQYFVHSYYVAPTDPAVVLATTTYGDMTFCSAVMAGNVFACQFHPERSGQRGLAIYRQWATASGLAQPV